MHPIQNNVLAVLILGSLLSVTPAAEAQQIRDRFRISFSGIAVPDTVAVPQGHSNATRGEMRFVTVEANQGEKVYLQVHQYYARGAIGDEKPAGEFKPTPPSDNTYKSADLGAATAFTEFTSKTTEKRNVSVFFPYNATALPDGEYMLKYRIRLWIDNQIVDDYYVDDTIFAKSTSSVFTTTYALAPGEGPRSVNFSLKDADPPKVP